MGGREVLKEVAQGAEDIVDAEETLYQVASEGQFRVAEVLALADDFFGELECQIQAQGLHHIGFHDLYEVPHIVLVLGHFFKQFVKYELDQFPIGVTVDANQVKYLGDVKQPQRVQLLLLLVIALEDDAVVDEQHSTHQHTKQLESTVIGALSQHNVNRCILLLEHLIPMPRKYLQTANQTLPERLPALTLASDLRPEILAPEMQQHPQIPAEFPHCFLKLSRSASAQITIVDLVLGSQAQVLGAVQRALVVDYRGLGV